MMPRARDSKGRFVKQPPQAEPEPTQASTSDAHESSYGDRSRIHHAHESSCDLPLQCPAMDVLSREVDDMRKTYISLSIRDLMEGRYSFGAAAYSTDLAATVMGVRVPSAMMRQLMDSSSADHYVAKSDFAGGANDSFLMAGQTRLRAKFKNLRLRIKPADRL